MRFVSLLVAGAFVLAPVAHARTWLPAAQQIAVAYWGANPCGGQVDVSAADLAPGDLGGSTNAVATYTLTDDVIGDCRIVYNWRIAWTWQRFCTVTVHEYGHLTGHPHTDTGVMAPIYTGPIPECAR